VNYTPSPMAIALFIFIVVVVLVMSFYFARRTRSASGYYAAGGRIHWSVNGIAFAGDYLSAASFLGICGMIATFGYDGFLYSIGYLAGWIVALFVVAEPIKRLGRYTFSDAIDAKFGSRGIRLMAAISTLVVSVFYLIPQMVGAGSLVTPLLGLPHSMGVMMVGAIVIIIVATAGMASTTYVQFIKGGLLVVFSTILVALILSRGLSTSPDQGGRVPYHEPKTLHATLSASGTMRVSDAGYTAPADWGETAYGKAGFVTLTKNGEESVWQVVKNDDGSLTLNETLWVTARSDGTKLYNGAPASEGRFYAVGQISEIVRDGKTVNETGPLNPLSFLSVIRESTITLWGKKIIVDGESHVTVYYPKPTPGARLLRPGLKFKIDGGSPLERLDFISLMLALFCGTAALPHILIRYYTVPSPSAARKSTIVAIAAIGFFYVLTLFMGLGAMTGGVVNLLDDNMSAPLLAQSFGGVLFACISAIAFATVLGTVSGLIVAATGAIAHDLMDRVAGLNMSDSRKVLAGKVSAIVVGILAILLGNNFEGMNVSFLVGWAFAVAASANLPAIIMLLFWRKTTKQGVMASITAGLVSAVTLILLSPDMYERYGLLRAQAPVPLSTPAIVSIPIGFIALVVVSLLTQKATEAEPVAVVQVSEAAD
jgi:cation/acetate symporter